MAWTVRATAVAAAVVFGAGAVVQSHHPFLPQEDLTLGWKDHFWEHYGQALPNCIIRAKAEASGRIDCVIDVRAR